MPRRVPQPPVDAARRDSERHDFWTGGILLLLGGLLVLGGTQRLTSLDTVTGGTARETQLIQAFSSGGLKLSYEIAAPTPPLLSGNAAADADAVARWEAATTTPAVGGWLVRVDTGAKTPCPT